MGTLGVSSDKLTGSWLGMQSEASIGMMKSSLEIGTHARALSYTHGMTEIMSGYQPIINQLRARREQIGKNLQQNNYAEPDLGSYTENELILNYECMGSVDEDCENALQSGREAARILAEMIEDAEECAEGYFELTEIKELFEEGKKKVDRIENYKEAFDVFARKMNDFEYEMSYDLSAKMKEIEGLCSSLNSMETVENDVEERLDDIEQYDMEKLNETLDKDVSEWTQEDIEFVAQEYTEAIDEKDVETLNDIAAVLCENSFDVEQEGAQFYGTYYGGIPQDIRISILSCIDPNTEGEAYFTLSRLANENFCIDVNMGVYPYDKYETTLQFSVDENGQLTADLKCVNHFNKKDEIEGELKITSEDLYESADIQNMKVLGFSDEEIVAILSGAVTDTDVECVSQLCACKTEEDYAKLFEVNPEELSTEATMSYCLYSYGLLEKSFLTDEEGNIYTNEEYNFEQFTALLNGILSKPDITIGDYEHSYGRAENYTVDYLALMAVNTETMLEANSALIYSDYNSVTDEMINNQYKLWNMQALYLALEEQEMRINNEWGIYTSWDNYYSSSRIENLGFDLDVDGEQTGVSLADGEFSYSVVTMNQKGKEIERKTLGSSKSPLELEADEELLEYNEKVKEARYAPIKETINGAILIASIAHPELIAGVSILKLVDDPNLDKLGTVSSKTGAVIKNYKEVGNGFKTAGFVIDAISNIQSAYEERDKAYEEILDDWYESGIKIAVMKKADDEWEEDFQKLVAKGIYDPREIIKCRRLENEGFAFMYDNVTEYDYVAIGENEIQKCDDVLNDDILTSIEDNAGRSNAEKKEILLILWRGPEKEEDAEKVGKLTADEFQSYVEPLSKILSDVKLPQYVGEDAENIFENISLEGEYKNY